MLAQNTNATEGDGNVQVYGHKGLHFFKILIWLFCCKVKELLCFFVFLFYFLLFLADLS